MGVIKPSAAWKQITTTGLQSSPTVKQPPHDYLFREVTVREPGYAYVFVSNEHPTYVDVYFDDITVTHTPSPIVSASDYLAFGLQHTTGERAGVYEQRTLFQSQELQDELNLDWVQFKWRNHDPSIGRFFNVDPIAEKYYYNSTYAFSENKVIAHIELEGLEAWDIKYSDGSKGKVYGPFKDQNSAETFADDQLIISPVKDPKITSGISSARLDPVTQDRIRPHTGVDIVKSEGPTGGAKVSAPLNGKISEKRLDSGRGNYVHLTANKDGKVHRFYHMQDGSADHLQIGDNISRGEEIGKIGNTGHSTGNHLHYEVRSKDGTVLDPIKENPALKNGSSSTKSVIKTPVEDSPLSLKFITRF